MRIFEDQASRLKPLPQQHCLKKFLLRVLCVEKSMCNLRRPSIAAKRRSHKIPGLPPILRKFVLLRGFAPSRGKKSMCTSDDKASRLPASFSQPTALTLHCLRVFECENSMCTCEGKASRLQATPTRYRDFPPILYSSFFLAVFSL